MKKIKPTKKQFLFGKRNYQFLLLSISIISLGFILMIGGGSDDPNKFDASELFSDVRITLSPMLIIAGYLVIMYSIMRKTKKDKTKSID